MIGKTSSNTQPCQVEKPQCDGRDVTAEKSCVLGIALVRGTIAPLFPVPPSHELIKRCLSNNASQRRVFLSAAAKGEIPTGLLGDTFMEGNCSRIM